MNKKVKIIYILLTLAFVFPVTAESALVTFVKGKVEISSANGWMPVKVGDMLNASDTISTGFQSEAKIEYNGSVMALGALTRITIDKLSSNSTKDDVSVYLSTGAVRSKVNHSQNKRISYSVKSPVAVASVRGTDFLVTAGGTITCSEGAVAVYANREKRRDANINENSVEEQEEVSESDDKTESATATTPADEIDSKAPVGTIVVGKNQEVTFTITGTPETPMITAIKKTEKAINTVTTAAVQETVTIGASSAATSIESQEQQPELQSSSLTVTVELED